MAGWQADFAATSAAKKVSRLRFKLPHRGNEMPVVRLHYYHQRLLTTKEILPMKIFAYALLLILTIASVSEARGGRLLKRARHPFGGSCANGVCK